MLYTGVALAVQAEVDVPLQRRQEGHLGAWGERRATAGFNVKKKETIQLSRYWPAGLGVYLEAFAAGTAHFQLIRSCYWTAKYCNSSTIINMAICIKKIFLYQLNDITLMLL